MEPRKISDKLSVAPQIGVADVAEARAQGFRIVPLCPFLRAQFERHHPEWADVMRVD